MIDGDWGANLVGITFFIVILLQVFLFYKQNKWSSIFKFVEVEKWLLNSFTSQLNHNPLFLL